MKKIMIITVALLCTASFAQEGLEQYYLNGGKQYHESGTAPEQCVTPVDTYDDDAGEYYQNYGDQEECTYNPEKCNCLNHNGGKGRFSEEPVYRGTECVPVEVRDWDEGEKMWYESDQEYPRYWCEGEETHRGNYNQDNRPNPYYNNQGYRGEDYYNKSNNPEGGLQEQDCDDCLPHRGQKNGG